MRIIFRVLAGFLGVVLVYVSPMAIYKGLAFEGMSVFMVLKMHAVFLMGLLFLYSSFAGINLFTWRK